MQHTGGSIMQKTIYAAAAALLLVWSQVNAATTSSVSQDESQFGKLTQLAPISSLEQRDWFEFGGDDKWRDLLNSQLSAAERQAYLEGIRDKYLESHEWHDNGELWGPELCMGAAAPAGCDFVSRLDEIITRFEGSSYYDDGRFADFLQDEWLQDKHDHWQKPVGEVPLPPAIALFGSALLGLGWLQRRRAIKN
jgi:hypothetical protein